MTGTLKRITVGVGTAALAITLAGATNAAGQNVAPAQGPEPGGRGGFGRAWRSGPLGPGGVLGGLMLGRLDLTEAQRDQIKSILDSHRNDLRSLGERLGTARRAMEAAISADAFDEATVRTRAADLAAVEADMAVMRARIRGQVVQILTGEQLSALKNLQGQTNHRHDKWWGRGWRGLRGA